MINAVGDLYNAGTTTGYNNGRSIFIDYTWSGWTNSAAGVRATKSIDIRSNYSKYNTLTASNFRVYTRVFNGTGGSGLAFTIDSYNSSNGVVVIATTIKYRGVRNFLTPLYLYFFYSLNLISF